VKPDTLFATEARAARFVDMPRPEFRRLVDAGHLPKPRKIGQLERFDLDELRRVVRGDLIGGGGMEW
jgi:predicted DNA-binding transcriptional regulator AlpA